MGEWAGGRVGGRIAAAIVLLSAGPAVRLSAQCPDGAPPPCRGAPAPSHSVAVLYFENRSSDSADAYLADGLTEEVISRLSAVERLRVVSRHLVRRYRGAAPDPVAIARSLNVAYLVTGSVRRSGGRLRVSAELVQAGGRQVWGRQFDESGGDVFAIQEAVAREVASGIVGRLIPSEQAAITARPTRQAAAYDAVLRGNFSLARRDSIGLVRAIDEYETALRLDTSYADARARLALALALSEWNGSPVGLTYDTVVVRSLRLARQAVAQAPSSADAWLALAVARGLASPRDLGPAIEAGRRAVMLDSSSAEAQHALGTLFQSVARGDSAAVHQHRALAIEPRRPITLINFAEYKLREGRWAESEVWIDSALRFDPDFAAAHALRLLVLLVRRDDGAARAEIAGWPTVPSLRPLGSWVTALLSLRGADSAAIAGFRRATPWAADDQNQPVLGMLAAGLFLTGVGDREGALVALEHTRRSAALAAMMQGTIFAPLRNEPRYQRVLRESMP